MIEGLESRTLLSNVSWTNANGGDWDTASNWSNNQVPGPNDNVTISLSSTETITHSLTNSDSVLSLTTNGSTNLKIVNGSLAIGAGSSTLGGPVTVNTGATLSVGATASVQIDSTVTDSGSLTLGGGDAVSFNNSTLTDAGALTFDSGDVVTLYNSAGTVSGSLTANSTTFTNTGYGSNLDFTSTASLGGGSNSYNLPISVPYTLLGSLAGNTSFGQVNIQAGTLSSGTLSLNVLGTNTANFYYEFPSGFTVASGGTMTVAANVPVTVVSTLTDSGSLTFGGGDAVSFNNSTLTDAGALTFDSGDVVTLYNSAGTVSGSLTANSTTFTNTGYGSNLDFTSTASLGGGSNSYNLPISVPYTLLGSLAGNTSFGQVNIQAGTLSSGTLSLNVLGTNTANFYYEFPSGFTVASGGTMTVAANVPVTVVSTLTDSGSLTFGGGDAVSFNNSTLTDAGALTFDSGDVVTLYNSAGTVSGSLTANSTTFTNTGYGSNLDFTSTASLGGGSNSYNLPISVPYTLLGSLAGNTSFGQVNIQAGTLSSGTLSLNVLGTNTANFYYEFPSGFTVASGGTMTVAANVPVTVVSTLTDSGSLTFGGGDAVSFNNSTLTDAGALTFDSGDVVTLYNSAGTVSGSLTANSTTFTNTGYGSNLDFTSTASLGGGSNSYNLPISVPYTLLGSLAGNTSFGQVNIQAGTLSSGTLSLNVLGTNTANFYYEFPSGFTVASGGTMTVAANVPVTVVSTLTDSGSLTFGGGDAVSFSSSTLTDAGALTFDSGDAVTLYNSAGTVSGSLTANSTTFTNTGYGSNLDFTSTASLGGGSNSYNLPISVPYTLIPSIGVNTNYFNNVNINSGTLPSGALLSLNQSGTDSALLYVFPSAFTVAAGATLDVGPNVSVLIESTLTDGGVLSFDTGDTVSLSSGVIAINGTMSSTNDTFTNTGGGSYIAANSGGQLNASNSTFSLNNLILNAGSSAQLVVNSIANEFSINSGATISITGNNFTNISNNSNQNIVASGNPNATITLTNNYWGTTNTSQIAAKITDHTTNSSLPTISYSPFLSAASASGAVSATAAANASTPFNSSSQTISLSATVTSGSTKINEGNETFLIVSGINVIGTPVTVGVANGAASTSSYTLPAGTAAGTYTIEAIYYGTGNYLGSIDSSHTLTVSAVSTTTAAVSASTNYSSVAQSVPLTATITSTGGTVNGGTVTFTILNGGTTIATATSNTVTNGAAAATVTLPAGTAVNNYTIQAAYSGSANFGGSSDSSQVLKVNSTSTTTAVTSSANPSVVGQFVTFAATVVASSPGLGTPTGTVTFMDGTTTLGTGTLSGGTATFSTSGLPLNANSITAVYGGSTTFIKSTSTALSQTVSQDGTTATLLSSVNPSDSGQSVVFTAVEVPASPGTGVPSGTVTFKDGTTVLAVETLGGGTATYLDSALSVGSHSITVVYGGDTNFKGNTSSVLTQVVQNPATASFIKEDTTTEGSWIGVYGAQGYDIVSGPSSLPSYATVTPSGQSTYTWTTTSKDPRALQVPGSSNRIAAVWYSSTSFTVALDLSDGQSHDLELYFDDWDNSGRSEKVQLSDAATKTVLDTESISSFYKGVYLDWKVSGDLVITITEVAGYNGVVNGLFLDSPTNDSLAITAPPSITAAASVISTTNGATPSGIAALSDVSTTNDSATLGGGRRRHAVPGHDRKVKETSPANRDRRGAVHLDKSKGIETHATRREPSVVSATIHDLALEQVPGRSRRSRSE